MKVYPSLVPFVVERRTSTDSSTSVSSSTRPLASTSSSSAEVGAPARSTSASSSLTSSIYTPSRDVIASISTKPLATSTEDSSSGVVPPHSNSTETTCDESTLAADDLLDDQENSFVSAYEKKLNANTSSLGGSGSSSSGASTMPSSNSRTHELVQAGLAGPLPSSARIANNPSNSSPLPSDLSAKSRKRKRLSMLYLDTTYCDPKYLFPSQEECVTFVGRTVAKLLKRSLNRYLILIGTYSLGKEKILLEVYKQTKVPICVEKRRYETIRRLNLPCDITKVFTTDASSTCIHCVSLWQISFRALARDKDALLKGDLRNYSHIVGFKPTGWSMDFVETTKGNVTIHEVPYSEHSSFRELHDCVSALNPLKIIPTVGNKNARASAHMVKLLRAPLKSVCKTTLKQQKLI